MQLLFTLLPLSMWNSNLFESLKIHTYGTYMMIVDVYEESEADLVSERNNNDLYRSTKSRSPDVTFGKGTKTDRKLSSGYFVCMNFTFFSFCFVLLSFYEVHLKKKCICWHPKKCFFPPYEIVLFFQINTHSSLSFYLDYFLHIITFCHLFFSFAITFFFIFFVFVFIVYTMGECGMFSNHFVLLFGVCYCYHSYLFI